jgi:hypothetical protein
MTNSMGHALLLLTVCIAGAGALLTLMAYAESTLDQDDPKLRSLVRRLWRHGEPQVVRAQEPTQRR